MRGANVGKKQKQVIGSWMSKERLAELHVRFEHELQAAQRKLPRDTAKITELKKLKLLCKDLIEDKQHPPEPGASAEVIPFQGKPSRSPDSLFFGRRAGLTALG
jgi:hypothetical protein